MPRAWLDTLHSPNIYDKSEAMPVIINFVVTNVCTAHLQHEMNSEIK